MLGREAWLRHGAILRGYATRLLVLLLRLLLRRHALRGRAPGLGLGLGKIQRGSAGAERAQRWLYGFAALARGLPHCGLLLPRALHGNQHTYQE